MRLLRRGLLATVCTVLLLMVLGASDGIEIPCFVVPVIGEDYELPLAQSLEGIDPGDSPKEENDSMFPPSASIDIEAAPWERMHGPPGGYISNLALCASNPSIIYAGGANDGIYKSTDNGQTWAVLPNTGHGQTSLLLVDPDNPNVVYAGFEGLSKSLDGGRTWRTISQDFHETMRVERLAFDPNHSSTLYIAGPRHDQQGYGVFKSSDAGENWMDISPGSIPPGCNIGGFAVQRNGVLFLGLNDRQFNTWGGGRLLASYNDGQTWAQVSYGTIEDRFVWSVFVNPWEPSEVWLSEGPLFNESISQPMLFRSDDNGQTWQAVYISAHGWDSTQIRVIGASSDGSVYIAAGSNLLEATDHGNSFRNITPPRDQMTGVDFFDIAIHPHNTDTLYLPLRSTGIAYTEDGGQTWARRDHGIATISANLVETDPFRPGTVYVSSLGGQGVYRSDDYGETWSGSLVGIAHPWGDEIDPDPHREGVVWFIADVPFVHRSTDFGDTWQALLNPREKGGFNFGSFYSFAQGTSTNSIYVADTGFGIFRGERGFSSGNWDWQFLRTSEVDYTYTLCVEPGNGDVVYSGYSSKPFQDFAMIRASYDGGQSWFTSLEINGADAVTSIDIDDASPNRVFAASTSEHGGGVWRSETRGENWAQPNPFFNFTTIHSFAVAPSDPSTVLVGVWGGGAFKTSNGGETWSLLAADEAVSAAGIAFHPTDTRILYVADRTQPLLHRSRDGGETFESVFSAGSGYSRLMGVTVDPSDPSCLYTIAMFTPSAMDRAPGIHGSLFRIESDEAVEITGDLPRLPLSVTVDPSDSDVLYAVLHGHGVYKSADRGVSWVEISVPGNGLPRSGFFSLTISPFASDTLYLVGGCDVQFGTFASAGLNPDIVNGVYRSLDGGASWTCLNQGVLGAASGAVKSITFSSTFPGTLIVAAENGLFVSTDNGSSWLQDKQLPYSTLGGAALTGDHILALTNGAGVFRGKYSSNGSIAWQPESLINSHIYFAQVLADSSLPGTLYASAYPGGIFKSTDGGETWHEANFGMTSFTVDDPLRQGYYALDLSRSNSDVLYLGLYGKGMYKSMDAAGTWRPMNGDEGTMVGQAITSLAVDPNDENQVFVSTETGVLRTKDGGRSWEPSNNGLPTLDVKTLLYMPSGALYAGTRGYGLFRWVESHGSWQAQQPVGQWGVIWPMWDDRPRYQYSDILFHATDDQQMLFGCFPSGIYKSTDSGISWRESNVGWTLDGVFSLISHPENPDIVYAGTYNGVNRSLDFGDHWELWDVGWPVEQWVFTIAFDHENPDIMYACSKNGENEGQGREDFRGTVMKSVNGGQLWFPITSGLPLDNEFYDLIVDPFDSNILYLAAQHDGMFISRNGGDSWWSWNQGLDGKRPATNGNNVSRVLALSADARFLYFGADGAGVYRREIHPEAAKL